MPYEILLLGSLLAAVFEIFVLIWAGRMGEKYGASKVILWGGIASALVAVPVVPGDRHREPGPGDRGHDRRRVQPCPSPTPSPAPR